MRNRNVLISGAGVAGPALAWWLRRYGFAPTVVERAPTLRDGGYKIDIRGVALTVVERMGLLDEIHANSTDVRTAWFVDRTGRGIAEMDAALFGGRTGADVEIMRGDLGRLLHRATRSDVEYLFDDSVTALVDRPDGVEVAFERAAARRFDLVIGADGVYSTVRSLAFGPHEMFVRGLGHYVSIFTVPNHLGLDREERLYAEPGRTVNVYSTRQDTAAKALFLWASDPLGYDRRDLDRQRDLLAAAFAGAGWQVDRLLAALPDAPDFYFDPVSQVHVDRWHAGRVALLGDAGYGASPASGQGTGLALVGAYVLAGELAAAGGDHRTAFARYDGALRDFVARNQALAPNNLRGMVLRSRAGVWASTRMIRLMPHLPGRDRMVRRVTEPIRRAASGIELADYPA
ncbi:FAD-dependent monooxygenase [Micromonospora zhanjiangensis]|uniref:FAD-dependent monooxygenase n=1 Tax=Micromonospora zhanjiangensis TaxID=1522057 RepID=A0ABV8KSE6_9ACTN